MPVTPLRLLTLTGTLLLAPGPLVPLPSWPKAFFPRQRQAAGWWPLRQPRRLSSAPPVSRRGPPLTPGSPYPHHLACRALQHAAHLPLCLLCTGAERVARRPVTRNERSIFPNEAEQVTQTAYI